MNWRPKLLYALVVLAGNFPGICVAQLDIASEKLQTGKYSESYAAVEQLLAEEPTAVVIAARAKLASGQRDAAEGILREGLKNFDDSNRVRCQLSELLVASGKWREAGELVTVVLEKSPDFIPAVWLRAELCRLTGKLAEAEKGYDSVIRIHKRQRTKDPHLLLLVGRASAQVARWQRKSQVFHSLVNEFYPSLLRDHPQFWQAAVESANLFLEKFNAAAATTDINSALAINPNAAAAHVARAALAMTNYDLPAAKRSIERALELNPESQLALLAQVDLQLVNKELEEAQLTLGKSVKFNSRDERVLGRQAAIYFLQDGDLADEESRLRKLAQRVETENPHCGIFYVSLADSLDSVQRFPAAAQYYRLALKRFPNLVSVRGKLGMTLMRLGAEPEASVLLKESFEIDPFNVRVKNMLAVLDVLQDYAVIETDHFVIRFDRGKDEILARSAAVYLEEEVYPEVVASLGYEPPEKSLFEIFNRARNSSGHSWFSARMVGLPFIGTVGACAGKIVALASPTDMPTSFNWARVLKHEFVHVVNLQQTNFNVPRWYTEGLAVWHERYPRPQQWNVILNARFRADDIYDLSNINYAFARPSSADDWTLAYCQAELYVEYMVHEFGEEAIAKMLNAYSERMETAAAVKHCFDVDVLEFEAGYRSYVKSIVEELKAEAAGSNRSFAELQREVRKSPADADLLAELAYAYLQRKSNTSARKYALLAKNQEEGHPLAGYVLARLYLSIGDVKLAQEYLEKVFDEDEPHEKVLALLAGLKLKAGDFDEAARLYTIGRDNQPGTDRWLKALAQVYLKADDEQKLSPVLAEIARRDGDNAVVCKKLAQLAGQARRLPDAGRWARRALQVDVQDGNMHALAAEAAVADGKLKRGIEHYQFALRRMPGQTAWQFALANAYVDAEEEKAAVETLQKLLKAAPDYPGADVLLESLLESSLDER